mmetsp:Transcript_2289/g.8165  ORF Transcript_2289/g.8165 Transcript_2289/m.8165 type:complete len:536 (+) Transcript_2289:218-1825(+)
MLRKLSKNHKKRRLLLFLIVLFFSIYLVVSSRENFGRQWSEISEGESFLECRFFKPAIGDSWYKPKDLSSPVTRYDFENCSSLTRRQKSVVALLRNSCRSNIEIFSSCKATSITLKFPDSSGSNVIQFTMNTSRDVGLIKVPGLGLERRDFSIDKKRTNNMAKWGEGAKRLEFELRPVHSSCEYRFSGNTYIVRAYHMGNLGHFYETIFRLYLELKNRSDLVSVRQIIILNAGKEVPYVALLEQLFPKVQIISPWHFSKKLVCVSNGIFVGFPNHALGRADTSHEETKFFHDFLRERFKLKRTREFSGNSRPLVVFMSRNSLPDSNRARRYLNNEAKLAEILTKQTKWDVQIVSMQNLKFQEQAQLMYETSMLVSVHTAGFYNVLFMQSGSIAIQINVAGTHFGTIEYEHRPQEPFWIRGMWQTPVERICSHRAVIFLELWAEPDPLHSKKFVGHKKMGHEIALEYKKWASTNIEDFEDKWKLCGRDDAFFDCFDGIANEMRAHSTADTLFIKPSKFMSLIHPYIPCVEKGYCKQ